jgi:small multidrug resistance pump
MKWFYLIIAIVGEVIATTSLKESNGFSNLIPSIICIIGYGITFYFLSLSIKQIPIGIAYALWGGLGIVLITTIGYFRFKQTLDLPAVIGLTLIVIGVIIVNGFSKTI